MSTFHFYPFNTETGSPMEKKLRAIWYVVEREVAQAGIDVHLQITRSDLYDADDFPEYDEARLLIDMTRGFEVALRQLAGGLGLHLSRDLTDPQEWHSTAEAWARSYLGGLSLRFDPPAPSKEAGTGRAQFRCSAVKKNGAPCRAMRAKGRAFCWHHQKSRAELSRLGEILDGVWPKLSGDGDSPGADLPL